MFSLFPQIKARKCLFACLAEEKKKVKFKIHQIRKF